MLQTLKSERDRLRKDVNRLNAAINALGGSAATLRSTASKRPTLSAAARARIAAAQRARWAKIKGKKSQYWKNSLKAHDHPSSIDPRAKKDRKAGDRHRETFDLRYVR